MEGQSVTTAHLVASSHPRHPRLEPGPALPVAHVHARPRRPHAARRLLRRLLLLHRLLDLLLRHFGLVGVVEGGEGPPHHQLDHVVHLDGVVEERVVVLHLLPLVDQVLVLGLHRELLPHHLPQVLANNARSWCSCWWCKVVVQGGGARWWCKVVVQGGGARCWCKVLVQGVGARCWCKVLVKGGGARWSCKVVVQGGGARWWCKVVVQGGGERCWCKVLVQTWMLVSLETVRVTGSPPVMERILMYILA